jgi:two-component system LytT family response regulator
MLEVESAVEVIGECGSGAEAVSALTREKPDLVLLDIEMPEMNGFEVLRRVGVERAPRVIFVTAHDQFAVKAFELEALDYLLKPFDAARLRQALSRARRAGGDSLPDRLAALLGRLDLRDARLTRILVRSEGRMSFVRVDEIDWIQAADNYVRVHAGREAHLVRDTLASLGSRLDSQRFVRVHRGAIVSVEAVVELRALFHGDYELRLKNGAVVPVGRHYRERLISVLGG